MPKQINFEEAELSDIHFDPKNANIGTERGYEVISDSIEDFGFIDAGILDKDNTLIGGNKRTKAATSIGHDHALIIDHDGKTPIYIRYKDFDLDSPDAEIREKSRRLAYMLNRSAQLSLKWDALQLEDDVSSGVDLSNLFDESELNKLLINARALPEVSDQEEPTLVSDHLVQIYCSADSLDAFMPMLNEWMQRDDVTVNIS